jgi:predicted RNase H-like HicB family nuclease
MRERAGRRLRAKGAVGTALARALASECVATLPVVITKEGEWFIARCPAMDLVTQGRTEGEARENMEDLIDEYLSDPDVPKPAAEDLAFPPVLVSVPVRISRGARSAKTPSAAQT